MKMGMVGHEQKEVENHWSRWQSKYMRPRHLLMFPITLGRSTLQTMSNMGAQSVILLCCMFTELLK
jgi:hypothetical protein